MSIQNEYLESKLKESSDPSEQVDLLNELSSSVRSSSIEKSLDYSTQAIEIGRKISYKSGLAKSYYHSGINYRLLSKYKPAHDNLEQAYMLFDELGNIIEKARTTNSIANIFINQRDYDKGIEMFNKSLMMIEKTEDKALEATILSNLGSAYDETGDLPKALEYYLRSVQIYTSSELEIPVTLLTNIGIVFAGLDENETALDYFNKALNLSRQKGTRYEEAFTLVNIAKIYGTMMQYDKAINILEEGSKILNEMGFNIDISITYVKENISFEELDEYKKSLEFKFKLLKLLDQMSENVGKASVLNDIGNIYLIAKKFLIAKKYFTDSLKICKEINDSSIELHNYIGLGNLNFKSGDSRLGFDYLSKALKIAREKNTQKDLLEVNKALYEGYKLVGNVKNALQHLEKFYEIEHELHNLDTDKKLKTVTIKNEIQIVEKEKKIALQEKEIYELKNVELAKLNDKLKSLNEEKIEILGITAHDLKNPLSGIAALSRRIEKDIEKMSKEEITNYIKEIEKTSKGMFDLVTKILDINAIESGKRNINPEPIDPSVIMGVVMFDYRQRAIEKNIELVYQQQELPKVLIDKTSLRQILDNLVSNAVKFTPHGRKIYLYVTLCDETLRCEIHDEGPGLTEDDKTKLFTKFARLSAQPTGEENSTGLGLSISKKLVEILNGKILCESEIGKGAKFIVELPIKEPEH